MRRPFLMAVFAVALLGGEARAQCDEKGKKEDLKQVAVHMEVAFLPKPTAELTKVRLFAENGVWLEDRLVPPASTIQVVDHGFYPEKTYIAAAGPRLGSTICVRGKGKMVDMGVCAGTFALDLTELKPSRRIVVEAARAAAVDVTLELPRQNGGFCWRRVETSQAIEVADGEQVGLAVKKNAADRPASVSPCGVDLARADTNGKVKAYERTGVRGGSTRTEELVANCKDVVVRVQK